MSLSSLSQLIKTAQNLAIVPGRADVPASGHCRGTIPRDDHCPILLHSAQDRASPSCFTRIPGQPKSGTPTTTEQPDMPPKPVMLVILDGFGWREESADNAVRLAKTPNFSTLWSGCPHAFLRTSG